MDNRPIGVFDSGLGGLSVIKELERVLPDENIVYFGDTGRVPYGTKSAETICRYAMQDTAFLLSFDVKMIIAACGTVSSVASSVAKTLPVPYIEVVTPAAQAAVKATKNGKIGVLGTSATVNSGSYKKKMLEINSELEIIQTACPLFVQLVEVGWISKDDEVTVKTAERYLREMKESEVDTVILGCTHFPAINDIISDVLGKEVTLINAGEQAAISAARFLNESDMCGNMGQKQFFVSDRVQSFTQIAEILLGKDIEKETKQINIEVY